MDIATVEGKCSNIHKGLVLHKRQWQTHIEGLSLSILFLGIVNAIQHNRAHGTKWSRMPYFLDFQSVCRYCHLQCHYNNGNQ